MNCLVPAPTDVNSALTCEGTWIPTGVEILLPAVKPESIGISRCSVGHGAGAVRPYTQDEDTPAVGLGDRVFTVH